MQALRGERLRLLQHEAEASQLVAQAQIAQDPFESAFHVAHQALLTADRARLTKPALFGLYDARLAAGHAWSRPRQKLRDADRWLKAIRSELLSINMELE